MEALWVLLLCSIALPHPFVVGAPFHYHRHRHMRPWWRQHSERFVKMGDMIVGEEQLMDLQTFAPRNGIVDDRYRWPEGVIPYEIGEGFNGEDLELIQGTMDIIEKETCIRFKRRTDEYDYVSIETVPETECSSPVGRQGGKQVLMLGGAGKDRDTCVMPYGVVGTIAHEFMHAIGFFHEMTRGDRDDYIKVLWDNIVDVEGIRRGFEILYGMRTYGLPFDYDSIMLYTPENFSIAPGTNPTWVPTQDAHPDSYKSLTELDKKKINAMYYRICPGT